MHHNPASRSRSDSTRPGGSPAPYGARRLLGERVIYTVPGPFDPHVELHRAWLNFRNTAIRESRLDRLVSWLAGWLARRGWFQ